jgi:hypothetical protein
MIEKIITQFKKHKIRFAICGGVAVVAHGVVRGTMDLDILCDLTKKQFVTIEAALKELGFASTIPVEANEIFQFREEYIKNRNLIAWSFYNKQNPLEVVDVLLTHSVDEFDVEKKQFKGMPLPLLSIDSLITLKRIANRPQDKIDIEALEKIKKLQKKTQ